MKLYSFCLILLAFEASTGAGGAQETVSGCVLAQTKSGLVCGLRKEGIDGKPFVSFLGVPYAKAPLGELRFAEPQRPEPFSGVFNATVQGPICPQNTSKIVGLFMRPTSMSEDCLHVNIHVPLTFLPDLASYGQKSNKTLLPILVFIHGGSYTSGAGDPDTHGPEYLMTKDIMVVTLNYRIGALGFLSLRSREIPGNNGLRDIIFALQWIKRNIRNFGGDPDRVTIGGMSSGAGLAHLLSTSPATKGKNLFKRLILMSNTMLSNTIMSAKTAQYTARLFLKGMGIDHLKDPAKIHQALIKAPIGKILDAQLYVVKFIKVMKFFAPVVDNPRRVYPLMVPKPPEKMLDNGYDKDYEILFGVTNAECAVYPKSFDILVKLINMFPALLVPPNLSPTANIVTLPIIVKMILKQYFNGSLTDFKQVVPYCTDSLWKYPILRTVDKRLATGADNTFLYEFGYEWQGDSNPMKQAFNTTWTGVGHSGDLNYVFKMNAGSDLFQQQQLSRNNSKFQEFLTEAFANFVKFGHPGTNLADWPPIGRKYEHMNIALPEPVFQPASPEMSEMKKFFDKLYRIGSGNILPARLKIRDVKRLIGV